MCSTNSLSHPAGCGFALCGLAWANAGIQKQASVNLGAVQDMKKTRRAKVPVEAYKDGPDGLKLYDVKLGDGALAQARLTQRLMKTAGAKHPRAPTRMLASS